MYQIHSAEADHHSADGRLLIAFDRIPQLSNTLPLLVFGVSGQRWTEQAKAVGQ
jgi:hypothetical protein